MDGDGNGEVSVYEFTEYITASSLSNVKLSPTRFGNPKKDGATGSRVNRVSVGVSD